MSKIIEDIKSKLITAKEGIEKIDLLNSLALELRDNDSRESLRLSENAKVESEKIAYEKGLAFSILNIGYQKDFLGNKKESIEQMNLALEMFKKLDDKEGLGYSYKYLAFYYWGLGEINKALDNVMLGIKANEGKNNIVEGWSYFVLAVFYNDLKEDDLSIAYFKKSIQVFEPITYEHGWGRALNGLCHINYRIGNYEKALAYGEKSITIHKGSGYDMGLARSYNDLGSIHTALGDYQKAADLLTKSLLIREKAENPQAVITTLTELGIAYTKLKAWDKSINYLNKAIAIAEKLKARSKLIKIHNALANLYKESNDYEKALQHAENAHKVNTEVLKQDADSRVQSIESKFEAEHKEKEAEIHRLKNVELKNANENIRLKNIALQDTIDELTKAKISKKATTITMILAIILFLLSEGILDPIIESYSQSTLLSMSGKLLIAILIKPIEQFVERSLTIKAIKEKKLRNAIE